MIGAEFASRSAGLPPHPVFDDDSQCPVCVSPTGACVGHGVAHQDQASRIREFAVARGQQQTRRASGRPDAAPEVKQDPAPAPEPLEVSAPEVAVEEAPAPAAGVTVQPGAPAVDPGAWTLSPSTPDSVVDPNGESPRFVDAPTLVRTGPGVFRSQGVDAGVAKAPIPATDPTEVRDVYVVPDGVISPEDDPHRPDPASTVLVSDASSLIATGAWASLPGGTQIATTRKVLRVWWAMGTLSPSYSTVADVGVVLPKPVSAA